METIYLSLNLPPFGSGRFHNLKGKTYKVTDAPADANNWIWWSEWSENHPYVYANWCYADDAENITMAELEQVAKSWTKQLVSAVTETYRSIQHIKL